MVETGFGAEGAEVNVAVGGVVGLNVALGNADAVKARYQSLRQKYKKAIEDEGKAGKVDSVKRLEAAMTALSFPDGRENRKSNYLEDSMRMLEEAGLLPKTE